MAEPDRPAEGASRAQRPKRIPIDAEDVLTFQPIPGYVTRVVNGRYNETLEERIERFKKAGYVLVEGHEALGDPTCGTATQMGSVISKNVGGGRKGVLMKIKKEWYDEDQARKQAKINATEQTMYRDAKSKGLTDNLAGQQLDGIKITR